MYELSKKKDLVKFFNLFLLSMFAVVILSGVGSSVGSYPAVDPNMILYYHFNNNSAIGENNTFVVDSSTASNNGTANNTLFKTGTGILLDGSFYFNSINSSIVTSSSSTLNLSSIDLTISMFIQFNGSANQYIISKRVALSGTEAGYGIQISSGTLRTFVGNGSAGSDTSSITSNILDGNWHHLAMTYNGSTKITYVDGSIRSNVNQILTGSLGNNQNLLIGRIGSTQFFNGSIDEVIIYNRSLSSKEIWDLYYQYGQCITPTDNTQVYGSALICSGTYILYGNNNLGALQILNNNSLVNCQDSTFIGDSSNNDKGAWFGGPTSGINNVTLSNCRFTNFSKGLNVAYKSSNINLINITTYRNKKIGIDISNSSNILILGNSFLSGVQNYFYNQGGINIIHDLNDYWYRSFQFPTYLVDRTEFYINNLFNNLSIEINNSQYKYYESLGLHTSNYFVQQYVRINQTAFQIFRDYMYFENYNVTSNVQSNIYNQTNSLIYFSNGSVACSDISTCDNNINITLTPNNYSYVLDNFNLTEGVTRQFSPLSISGSTTSKTITSDLTQSITATVVVNVNDCENINLITYNSEEWTGANARTICTSLTQEGYELTIESGNNLLSFGEGGDSLATRIMYLLLGFLALSVLLFAVGGFFMYAKNNFSSLTPMEFIKYSVLLLIFVVLIIALINYIIDII